MSVRKWPGIVADGDQHDVDEYQLRHDPCGNANGFAPSVFQCDEAQPDIQQQRQNLGGEPGIHKGILADAECQYDGRDDQQGIHDMRHDPDPAPVHDGRAIQLPDAAQKEQCVAAGRARDVYCFQQQNTHGTGMISLCLKSGLYAVRCSKMYFIPGLAKVSGGLFSHFPGISAEKTLDRSACLSPAEDC